VNHEHALLRLISTEADGFRASATPIELADFSTCGNEKNGECGINE
jgi:hypothetical protein